VLAYAFVAVEQALADHCGASLVSINVRGTRITDAAVEALAARCPRLAELNLECCLSLTDAGIVALGRGRDAAPVAPVAPVELLRTRAARSSFGDDRGDEEPGDESGSAGPTLQNLSISGCVRLTDVSVVAVAETCHRLSVVDLTQVYDITDSSVVALARSSGIHLRSVKLSRCGRITDVSISSLALNCPGLQSIAVDDCYNLSDASIIELATQCRRLETIDMSHCPRLTDLSVG
jgi:hypothetical protein